MKKILTYILIFFVGAVNAQHKISGNVTSADKSPLAGVSVSMPELQLNTQTDAGGNFSLNVPATGTFIIQFSHVGYTTFIKQINSADNSTVDAVLTKSSSEMKEVVITSNNSKQEDHIPYPVATYSKDELDKRNGVTLMSRLAYEPGIDRISAGIGVGKPVIRGNSFNRILLYSLGTRIENQQWDDRHDLGIPENGIEKVEVVYGPSALIYGADALGGALVFSDEKPAAQGTSKGNTEIGYNTSNGAIIGDFGYKKTNEKGLFYIFRTGGHFVHSYLQGGEAPPNSQVGNYAANSKFIDASGKAAIGVSKSWGVSKLTYSFYQQMIGIVELEPDSVVESEGEQQVYEVEAPYQDVATHVLSSENTFFLKKSKLNINIAYQHNDRKEFEPKPGGPKKSKYQFIGLKLNVFTYDAKWTSDPSKNFGITVGTQGMGQQNWNEGGTELLVPDAIAKDFAGYILARYDLEKWNFLGGLRADARSVEIESRNVEGDSAFIFPSDDMKNNYAPISASIGFAFHPVQKLTLKLNAATGFSAPNYAELGTYGKHEGVYRFEIGDPNLDMEQNVEGDLGIAWEGDNISLSADGFYNAISNYIYIAANGDSIDGLPVYPFQQNDATINGYSAGFNIHPVKLPWLKFGTTYSSMRGELNDGGDLPFIPADKIITDVQVESQKKILLKQPYCRLTISNYMEQTRVAEYELPTDAYTLLDFQIGGKFKMRKNDATLTLFVTNLTDEAYFNHLSIVKNIGIREMGRNIGFRLNMPFGSW